jgi:hypothetical protein
MSSDGSFTYLPPAGFIGVDSFTYTLRDDGTDSTAGNADDLTGIGTVVINVTEADTGLAGTQKVWYIDNSYAGANGVANGTSARPFTSTTNVSGATGPDAVGDTLHVATGSSNYGFFGFLLDQTLWGANDALVLNGVTLAAATAKPVFENAGGAAITLSGATGTNTIRGLSVANSAISSNNGSGAFGTLNISNTTMTGTSRKLDLANGTVNGTIDSLTATSGVNGVSLTGVNGTLTITTGAISGTSGDDFFVSGGTAVISYGGTITNSAGRSVNVASKTGGSVTFSGLITDSAGSTGISLTSNTGATINFSGGLSLTTTTNTAFTATGGGTVNVTGANNTLTSTTAAALNVTNTTIGASGLTFQSISSSGGTSNGIILDTTGTSGGLTVTGDGSNTSPGGNSSGGTIANKSGTDGSTTQGIGIYLNNTRDVVLRRMSVTGVNQNFGIRGFGVTNFTLQYCTVGSPTPTNSGSIAANLQGTNNSSIGEGAIYFGNQTDGILGLTGTASIDNCFISAGRTDNMQLSNGGGTLNRLSITNSTFGYNFTTTPAANAALTVVARRASSGNTVLNSTVTGCTFVGSPGNAANFTGQEPTTTLGIAMDTIFQNNTITNDHPQNLLGGSNITIAGFSTTTFNISNNSMRGANGSAITLQMGAPGAGSTVATALSGTIHNNTIGVTGVADSGSVSGNGIFFSFADNTTAPKGQVNVAVTNNIIRRYSGNAGIYADNTGGDYDLNFTCTGNTAAEPGSGAFAGLALAAGGPTTNDDIDIFARITGNNFSTGDPNNANDIIVGGGANGASTIKLAGTSGPADGIAFASTAAVQTFLFNNNNTVGTVASAYTDAPATVAMFLGAGATNPPLPSTLLFAEKEAQVPVSGRDLVDLTDGIEVSAVNPVKTAPKAPQGRFAPQTALTQATLEKLAAQAISRWEASGLTPAQKQRLQALRFELSDLNTLHLGQASGDLIQISRTAAGNAWFIDETPSDDAEFERRTGFQPVPSDNGLKVRSTIQGVDLLTTIMHEMGHTLGLPDRYDLRSRRSIMYGHLSIGERRLPAPGEAAGATPFTDDTTRLLGATINIGTLPAGKSVTIVGTVLVNDPANTQLISSQGTVSGSNFTSILTDDPAFAGTTNPTTTPVERPDAAVVSLNRASGSPRSAATATWQIVFDQPVSGLTSANFAAVNGGLGGVITVSEPTELSGPPSTTWNITVTTGTGSGTLGLNMVNDSGSLSHDITNQPFTGQVYTIDKIAPVFSSITRQTPSAQNTNADTLVFRATFSEAVLGVDAADFTVSGTTATITSVSGTGPYDITLSGGDLASLNGTVSLALAGAQNIADTAGNPLPGTAPATNETYTVDNTAPTVTLTSTAPNPITAAPFSVTAQFSEGVTGFDLSDVTVTNATKSNFVALDADTYTFNLTGTVNTTVTADVAAAAAQDAAGNANTAAAQFSRSIVDSVSITATSATAIEGGTNGEYTFTRGDSSGAITVSFQLDASSTAIAGTDFNLTSTGTLTFNTGTGAGTIVIPNGQLTATITLTALVEAQNAAETAETARLNVLAASGYAAVSPLNATVAINGNGFLVTTTANSGTGSLRQAVLNADSITGTDTITFSDGTGGSVNFTDAVADTITLSGGQITFGSNLTIAGPGADRIIIQNTAAQSSTSRVFNVLSSVIVRLSGLTITGGNCAGPGGGLIISGGGSPPNVTVIACAITGNASTTNGGGIYQTLGTLTVVNSTISGNTAAGSGTGGGIENWGTALTLINTTISGNSVTTSGANNGGGIFSQGGSTTIRGCTITGNTGVGGASGVRAFSNVNVANSIIAGNVNNTTLPDAVGTFTSVGGNLIGNVGSVTTFNQTGDQTGTGASPVNPQLAALANNGGPTQTHALLAASTALNGGLNAQIPADTFDLDGDTNTTEAIPFDQRGPGFIRAIGTVDIGAFELQKSVSIGNLAAISEGNSGTTNFVFTLTRTGDTSGAVAMTYTVSGAAVNGTDFVGGTLPTGTATITNGNATTTVTIPVSGDTLAELDEAFIVTLTAPDNGYVVAGAPATSTITNDDTLTVTINQASGQADPARTSPINFTVVFSEPVTGFNDADVTLGGAAAPATATVTEIAPNNGTTYNVAVSGMTAQGTVTASVGSNVALSAGGAGHAAATSTDNSVVFDSIAPTAGIVVADTTLLFGETSLVTITFSEAVTGFDNADLTIPNGTLTPVSSGDGITWTATFTPSADTEAATNVIALAMTGVADAAGNAGTGTTNSNNFGIDTLRPTVTLTSPVANPAPNVAFTLTATFSQAVTGFTSGDIATTNAVIGSFNAVSSTVYTLVLIPDGSGLPVSANVAANAANDPGGNGSTAATQFTRATYSKATISAAFGSAQVAISGTATLTYTLTNPNASHALTGVEFTDLLPAGLALGTPPLVANNLGGTLTAAASTRAITLSGGTLDPGETATVVLNITGTVTGVKTSNFLIVTSAEAPNITTQDVFKTASNTVPTFIAPPLNISRLFHDRRIITGAVDAADPTQTGRINRFGVISEIGVNKAFPGMFTTSGARNFESHNIVNSTASPQDVNLWINTSGVSGFVVAYLDSFDPVNPATNYLADSGSSWPNTAYMGFTIPAGRTAVIVVHSVNSGVFFDYALGINTPLPAGAVSTIPATLAALPSIEVIERSVSIADLAAISEGNSGTTNFVFTITRTGATTGSVAMTYTVGGAAVNAADFGGTLPTGTATIADGSATTTVTIPVSGDVLAELDEAFTVTLSAPNNGYLVTGAPATSTITNDDTLTVTLNQAVAQVDPTNATTINFTAVFSEAVTDFDDAADVTLTGTAGATTTVITGGLTTYNVAVSGMTGSGTVIASIPAASVISAGSAANAASTSTDNTVTYDNVAPALASAIAISDTALKIGDTATVTFTFTEAVTGFDSADLTVPNGSIPSVTSGDGGITWTGTLTPTASIEDASNLITLALTGVADIATNPGIGTTNSPNYAIDTVAPTVVLTSPAPNPTPNVPIAVTAQFSETVVGFVAGSVTVVNATVSSFVAVDGDTYTFNLNPTGSNLIVTADITTGATQDVAGNNNIAATQFARTINAAPEITVPLGAGGSGPPVLYGISNGYGVAADNQIYEINPATGTISNARQVTLAGFTVTNSQSLAAHPTTGVLYGVIQTTGGASARRLVTIDPATGVATQVGPFTGGLQFATLAFKPDGTLLGVTGNGGTTPETMYTISTVDASATLLLALGNGADGETIAFHPNGLLYHSSGNGTALFESVNLTTNVVTPIGSASSEMFAMGFHTPTMQFLGSDISSNLFSIDIATGARTPIGLINGPNDNRGLALAAAPGIPLLRLTGVTTGINSPIATVSDAETAAGSLVVTATTVPPGINVTNIVNNAGAVTADVSADAGMIAGIYIVVLNVFDGAINTTANLTIEVNNAPTVVAPGIADVRITIGEVLAIPLGAHFADVDLHTLTFTVSGNSVPAKASASITGGSNVTLTGLTFGTTDITIQADDGHSGLVTDTFQVAVGTVEPTPAAFPITSVLSAPGRPYIPNPQTAAFDFDVSITNTTAFNINGIRLVVDLSMYDALPPLQRPRLVNYSSPVGVTPAYVDYPYPVAIGETVTMRLTFFVSSRALPVNFAPGLNALKYPFPSDVPGLMPAVPFVDATIQLNTGGTVVLTWPSVVGQWYRIFYSDTLAPNSWLPSATPLRAESNQTQWIDTGAPFTIAPPGAARFYRVSPITPP